MLLFLIIATISHCARSDFVYDCFDVSAGLRLNGAATLRECDAADHDDNPQLREHGYTAALDIFTTTEANNSDATSNADGDCSGALQLTPPSPSKAGSAYYQSKVPVLTGFETTFTWKISEISVECTSIVDKAFSRQQHESCVTVGGDGFAFVVHSDPQLGKDALGGDGQDLGYGGIVNSIAIEFDTWTNTQPGSDDVFQDHIAIHAAGPLLPNSSTEATALGWRPHDIADGKTHRARIQYLPYVEERYFELMTASENLFPYMREGGGRGIGTLAVFVDQGIVEDRPLFAIPINLGVVLDLPDSLAFVGFTGSTGRKWQRHEILRWEWYESTAHDTE